MAKKKIETPETPVETPTTIEKTTEQTFDKMSEIVDETFKMEEAPETPELIEVVEPEVVKVEEAEEESEETPETPETPVVEEIETPAVEETEGTPISLDAELSRLLKSENYFNYLSCGRHLKGEFTEENLKEFYLEFKASDSLATANHYSIMKLLTKKFEK